MTRRPLAVISRPQMTALFAAMVATLLGGLSPAVQAAEIGFVEDFTLAQDRDKALKQLIPGTRDYYYYHALHLQNQEQFDKVEDLLKLWVKRYGYTSRVWEIKHRQALLTYDKNPAETLEYIRQRLGVHFNHHQESLGKQRNLPIALDQDLISRERLAADARRRYSNTHGFEDASIDWLIKLNLNPDERRHLLQRLQRPDYPNIVKLISDDLDHKHSRGFGSMTVHRLLTTAQLEALLKLQPKLLDQTNFVNIYMSKLTPNPDTDPVHNASVRKAYLERLWAFVDRLAPVHNSLKAHVLYHRLAFDRSQGEYDADRFMAYLKLPRQVSYMNPEFMKRIDNRRYPVNLHANYQSQTALPPIRDDEPLVRSYFHHFFVKAQNFEAYEPYVRDTYLKYHFAETKIVNGLGDPERWYSMISPSQYQALKDRIDLRFAYTNKKVFGVDEPISLGMHVKNVKSLLVKVYRINASKFYRDNQSEVQTSINLDGLKPNEEKTQKYDLPAVRSQRRQFEFPQLSQPGVYVIDFIGNGKSSRVVVRKGRLRYMVRTDPSGQVFTVLSESNVKLPTASLWLGGREYRADERGEIAVPFSNRPGRQPVVLLHGDLATLAHFSQESEQYSLVAGLYVDREALLTRKKTQVLIRPALYLNGTPVSLKMLENVRLVIRSVDLDGVSTTKEVNDFKLFEDREATFDFQCPPRLRTIAFTLRAKVKNMSQGKDVEMAEGVSYSLNAIDENANTQDVHFGQYADGYAIDLLGRTGEARSGQAVNVELKHRDFRNTVHVSLQTDAGGRIRLGTLNGIDWVRTRDSQGVSHQWRLPRDQRTHHNTVHGEAGSVIHIPLLDEGAGEGKAPRRDALSLLEVRGGTFVKDHFDAMTVGNGFVSLNKLPRGDYDLWLKDSNTRINVRVTEGRQREDYVLGENRMLERRNSKPLQVASVDSNKTTVVIKLQNASKFARVHVFATRFMPAFSAYGQMARVVDPEPYLRMVPKPATEYIEGRDIGDEYRYILERKTAKRHPGNMLTRPGLLLNPWAIRETDTGRQHAQAGTQFGRGGGQSQGKTGRGASKRASTGSTGDFANLDFLGGNTVTLLNMSADEEGRVLIKRDELKGKQHLHIVAVDPNNTIYRSIALEEEESQFIDLRLAKGLDPKTPYTEQKSVSIVGKGGAFELGDITTSRFEAYDSLGRAYALLATLNRQPHMMEFSFVLNWPNMDEAEKNEKYSKYACHELNFFIARKDPQYFRRVVLPYLANKRDRTFMDDYLLGHDLAGYLQPWAYNRLNVVERVLLSQRIQGERRYTSRHVNDLFAMIPPNPDRFDHLFRTALKSHALDAGDQWGFNSALDKAAPVEKLQEQLRRAQSDSRNAPGADPRADGAAGKGASSRFAPPAKPRAPAPTSRPQMLKLEAESKEMAKLSDLQQPLRDRKADYAKKSKALAENRKDNAPADDMAEEADGVYNYYKQSGLDRRKNMRQYYRKLEKTKEWVENNYYKLPIQQQVASLVTVNGFWKDFANHDPSKPFHSANLAEATSNFTEMMLALAVLDLPFKAGEHDVSFKDASMTLKPGSPMLVFHKQIKPAQVAKQKTPILVSQNFFRNGDRYRTVNGERVDKYVTDEFLVHVVYGCQVVITNPTSTRQKLDVLLQVPAGAIPVMKGQKTRSVPIRLEPYSTRQFEYYFYFPAAGDYAHYPVHVAKSEQVIAKAPAVTLNVVDEPTRIDKQSWDYVSQFGTEDDVMAYLEQNNLHETRLDRIAWRMKDAGFFGKVIGLLDKRHAYNHTLWSYGLKHNALPVVQQFLQHNDGFIQQCGQHLVSKPLTIEPVVRHMYEHMEYSPLVNARAHQLGKRRNIVNERVAWQYNRMLKIGSYKRGFDGDDLMAITYYLALQDRVDEANAFFKRVDRQKLKTQVQYDYMQAYLDFYNDTPTIARQMADKYAKYPVDKWRNRFAEVGSYLDEIQGEGPKVVDEDDRNQAQTKLAATEPGFEFKVESRQINLTYQNLATVRVNFYEMDIELLFSRNPFVSERGDRFSYIKPNASIEVELPKDKAVTLIDLPKKFHNSNVLVEVVGAGESKNQAYYANSLAVQLIESYGQVKVTNPANKRPLSKVYVKVYGRLANGTVRFYKDGYTDLRGRFDYSSLNTNELDSVQKFAVLIYSEKHGAVIREATPPKQ